MQSQYQTGQNFPNLTKGINYNNKQSNTTYFDNLAIKNDDFSGNDSKTAIPPAPPLPSSSISSPPPPPPPPLPPTTQSNFSSSTINSSTSSNPTSMSKTVGAREDLMDAIKAFQGFTNKGSTNLQNRISDPPPQDAAPSILDQLKNELIKRAQYLSN
jgi:hypothetical protein